MDSRKFNKYKIISEILETAKQAGIAKIQHGNTSKDVMDAITTTIDGRLDKVYKSSKKDITLPPCISVNNVVAHDRTNVTLQYNDVVKLEVALHLDNLIVYTGDTVVIQNQGTTDETTITIMDKVNKVMELMIKSITLGRPIDHIDSVMEEALSHYGLKSIMRPYDTEHTFIYDWCQQDNGKFFIPCWMIKRDEQLEPWVGSQYQYDTEDDSKNYTHDTLHPKVIDDKAVFAPNTAYFLEVCCTDGNPSTQESDKTPCLYQRTEYFENVKSARGKQLLNQIKGKHVWDLDDIDVQGTKLAIREPHQRGLVRSFPIVQCKPMSNVYRMITTVYCDDKGVHVLTPTTFNKNIVLKPSLQHIAERTLKFSSHVQSND